ncbi:MAG: DUF4143 domain-containing protein [Nitrososphaeria archaeon]
MTPSFHRILTTELKKSKKVYFNDLGLRNTIMDNFTRIENRTDKGQILENFVLNELKSQFEGIRYCRTTGKAEVDFIINVGQELVPVEVESHPKIERSFLSFLENYKPKRSIIFTENEFKTIKIKNTQVLFAPHYLI